MKAVKTFSFLLISLSCFGEDNFVYKVSKGQVKRELDIVHSCCKNITGDSVINPEGGTCRRGDAANACIRENMGQQNALMNKAAMKFASSLPDPAFNYIKKKCSFDNFLFRDQQQIDCVAKILKPSKNPDHQKLLKIARAGAQEIRSGEPNFKSTYRDFNRYARAYNGMSVLKTSCFALAANRAQCPDHQLNFKLSQIPYSPEMVLDPSYKPKPVKIGKNLKGASLGSGLDRSFYHTDKSYHKLEKREEKKKEAEKIRDKTFFGCRDLDDKGSFAGLCVDWKSGTSPMAYETRDGLNKFNQNVFLKDISQFAAKKLLTSLVLGIADDQKLQDHSCLNQDQAKKKLNTYLNGLTKGGASKLSSCLKGKLGAPNLLSNASGILKKASCKKSSSSNRCENPEEPSKYSKEKSINRFKKAHQKIRHLKSKMKELMEQSKNDMSGEYICPDNYSTCGDWIEKQVNCEKRYSPKDLESGVASIGGCVSIKMVKHEFKKTYMTYRSLKQMENKLYKDHPELLSTVKFKGKEVDIDSIDLKEGSDWQSIHLQAKNSSLKKNLDFINDKLCGDPSDFAQKLLVENSPLVDQYLRSKKNKNFKKMMCYSKARAIQKAGDDQVFKFAAMGVATTVGLLAAIPSGGTSLALTLGAAELVGGLAITGVDLYESRQELQRQTGLMHGCVGDYQKLQDANDMLDDAIFWAGIELATPVVLFSGLKAYEKLAALRKLKEGVEGSAGMTPEFSKALDKAEELLEQSSQTNANRIANQYGLGDHAPKDLVAQIDELENMGYSAKQINDFLQRGCPR